MTWNDAQQMLRRLRCAVKEGYCAAVIALLLAGATASLSASPGASWDIPELIEMAAGPVSQPILIQDQSGGAHLFYLDQLPPEQQVGRESIRYSRLDHDTWSAPVIVFKAPTAAKLLHLAVALDEQGWFHVVWRGHHDDIQYSRAHLTEATRNQWSRPDVLSADGGFRADIRATSDGHLQFVYASRTGEVYYRRSTDRGRRWSDQVAVSKVKDGYASEHTHVAMGEGGQLHVVWSLFGPPPKWPPAGVFYGRSTDGGAAWSRPLQVASGNSLQINVATAGTKDVHLVWYAGREVGKRMHRWSSDTGATWSLPGEIDERLRGGTYGETAMAVDSAASLYVATSTGKQVLHSAWSRGTWSEPFPSPIAALAGTPLYAPSLVISLGNRLHMAYDADHASIWYTESRTTAAGFPPRPIPTPPAPGLLQILGEFSPPFRVLIGLLLLFGAHAAARRLPR